MKKPLTPFLRVDYSALESRAIALSGAPPQGTTTGRSDLHTDRSATLFDTPAAAVTKAQRDYAKLLNYADRYTPKG